jgi:hypothetical protein
LARLHGQNDLQDKVLAVLLIPLTERAVSPSAATAKLLLPETFDYHNMNMLRSYDTLVSDISCGAASCDEQTLISAWDHPRLNTRHAWPH